MSVDLYGAGQSCEFVGAAYNASHYCAECVVEVLISDGRAAPHARDMAALEVLDAIAEAEALEWYERCDSSVFPQRVEREECENAIAGAARLERCASVAQGIDDMIDSALSCERCGVHFVCVAEEVGYALETAWSNATDPAARVELQLIANAAADIAGEPRDSLSRVVDSAEYANLYRAQCRCVDCRGTRGE